MVVVSRVLLLAAFLCSACEDPCAVPEDSDARSSATVEVDAEAHPEGRGHVECSACHNYTVIHTLGCMDGVDFNEVNDRVAANGDEACSECHGTNGVAP